MPRLLDKATKILRFFWQHWLLFWNLWAIKPRSYTYQQVRRDGLVIFRPGRPPLISHQESKNPKSVGKSGVQKLTRNPNPGFFRKMLGMSPGSFSTHWGIILGALGALGPLGPRAPLGPYGSPIGPSRA